MTLASRVAVFGLTALTAAALLHQSYAPAWACSCGPIVEDGVLQVDLGESDLVIEGAIAARLDGDADDHLRFDVHAVYSGDASSQVVVDLGSTADYRQSPNGEFDSLGPGCDYLIYGSTGDRYVLFLSSLDAGVYRAGGCASFAVAKTERYDFYLEAYEALQALVASPTPASIPQGGGAPAQAEADHKKDAPLAIIIPAAILLPLAVLFIGSLVKPKGGGH